MLQLLAIVTICKHTVQVYTQNMETWQDRISLASEKPALADQWRGHTLFVCPLWISLLLPKCASSKQTWKFKHSRAWKSMIVGWFVNRPIPWHQFRGSNTHQHAHTYLHIYTHKHPSKHSQTGRKKRRAKCKRSRAYQKKYLNCMKCSLNHCVE